MEIKITYDGEGNVMVTKPDGSVEYHYVEYSSDSLWLELEDLVSENVPKYN